jgi:hypothetical protein
LLVRITRSYDVLIAACGFERRGHYPPSDGAAMRNIMQGKSADFQALLLPEDSGVARQPWKR